MEHRDETGQPCTRHGGIGTQRLLEMAMIGSRAPGFHHDAASKLQSLMMAVDELNDLLSGDASDLHVAAETAATALRELQQLFTANRALAKPPQRTRVPVGDMLARASERIGVPVRGDMPSCEVRVAQPVLVHALALVLDIAAGAQRASRAVDVTIEVDEARVALTLAGTGALNPHRAAHASEALAIATFALAREGGELRCAAGEQFTVTLPLATASEVTKP